MPAAIVKSIYRLEEFKKKNEKNRDSNIKSKNTDKKEKKSV